MQLIEDVNEAVLKSFAFWRRIIAATSHQLSEVNFPRRRQGQHAAELELKNNVCQKTKHLQSNDYLLNTEFNDLLHDLVHLLQQLIPLLQCVAQFPV